MVIQRGLYNFLTYCTAVIWLINGLFCKVLNMVPRHEQIVARILGPAYSNDLTKAIGLAEIAMAIWIITRFKSRVNSLAQIALIALMNILEFLLARDLLLFHSANLILAGILILVIYYKEFALLKPSTNIL